MKKKTVFSFLVSALLLITIYIPAFAASEKDKPFEEVTAYAEMVVSISASYCAVCGSPGSYIGFATDTSQYNASQHRVDEFQKVQCANWSCQYQWKEFWTTYLQNHSFGTVYNNNGMLQRDCHICHYIDIIRWR